MERYFNVNDSDFNEKVIKSELPVLVDFWAAWCAPCGMIAASVEEIAIEYEGRVKVAKLDVDANSEVTGDLSINSIPTLIMFKEGKAVDKLVGAVPKSKIIELVESVL